MPVGRGRGQGRRAWSREGNFGRRTRAGNRSIRSEQSRISQQFNVNVTKNMGNCASSSVSGTTNLVSLPGKHSCRMRLTEIEVREGTQNEAKSYKNTPLIFEGIF